MNLVVCNFFITIIFGAFIELNMMENMCMKGLESATNKINDTMHNMMEDANIHHNNYMQHCHVDMSRLEQVKVLGSLKLSSTLTGNVNYEGSSRKQPFQLHNVKLHFPIFDYTRY